MLELEDHGYGGDKRISMQLAQSEIAILDAASRIYSAYIVHGVVESGKERKYMRAAVKEALAMAANIDEVLKADGEL